MQWQTWLYTIPLRLRSIFRRSRVERELEEELRFHLEARTHHEIAAGRTPEEARYAALRAMEGLEQRKEECRDMRHMNVIDNLVRDVRYAVRTLARSPGFTMTALLALALGIGANTAVFSVMNAVLFKSLPVENPEQLVVLRWAGGKGIPKQILRTSSGYGPTSLSWATFTHLRTHSEALSTVFAFVPTGFNNQSLTVSRGGQPSLAAGEMVSGGYFSGLGVRPILGRAIIDGDEKPESATVAVISHSYWLRQFAGDPAVIGASIKLNRTPFTIIGVAPPKFFGIDPGRASDIWAPLKDGLGIVPWGEQAPPGESILADNSRWNFMIGGRMKEGLNEAQVLAELDVLFQRSITEGLSAPQSMEDLPRLKLIPARGGLHLLREHFSAPLWVLMTGVGLVLLIACANVATLMLARAAARQREMSVRLATGASRARLIRQLLTESMVLAVLGGGLGLLFAQWGSRSLILLMSGARQSFALDIRPDGTVLAFSAAVCIVTAAIFGVAPALRATRVDLVYGLREARASSPRIGLGKALVAGQVALSLLLLIGAGLFLRTLDKLMSQEIGFDRRNLLLFAIDAGRAGNTQAHLAAIYQRVLENIQAVPGVRSATASRMALLTGWISNTGISTDGPPLESGASNMVYVNDVGPAFFETMGIPLVLGREIDWQDIQGARRVVAVNQAMAQHFFRDGNPLGHRIRFGNRRQTEETYEIVGVVGNAKYDTLRQKPPRTVYVPYTSSASTLGRMFFEVRTAGDPAVMLPAVRDIVRRIDPEMPLIDVKTQTDQIEESLTQERMFARLASFFAALALLLVSVGLYGTLAYTVTRRTNEIGIRMALGAKRIAVLWMVLRQSLLLVVVGAAIGLPVAFATTRFIASQLYGVDPNDVVTVSASVFVLGAVSGLAAYIPARRASRVDPMVALRYE